MQGITKAWPMMACATCHRICGDKCIEDSLLRGVRHGLEKEIDAVFIQDAKLGQCGCLIMGDHVGGGEPEGDVTGQGCHSTDERIRNLCRDVIDEVYA